MTRNPSASFAPDPPPADDIALEQALARLQQALEAERGDEFWSAMLDGVLAMSGAAAAGLWHLTPGSRDPADNDAPPTPVGLQKVRVTGAASAFSGDIEQALRELAGKLEPGQVTHVSHTDARWLALAAWQPAGPAAGSAAPRLLIALCGRGDHERGNRGATVLGLALHVAERAREQREAGHARQQADHLHQALDLMLVLQPERRFVALAMRLVNELAARFSCDRVSLGLLHHGSMRLRALSHTEKFDRKTEASLALIAAMEEAVDQGIEIQLPAPEDSTWIDRDHKAYARSQGLGHVLSLPLFPPGHGTGSALSEEAARSAREDAEALDPDERETVEAVGALTFERESRPFTPDEAAALRVIADQAVRLLLDLHRSDRWFGARWAAAARRTLARLLGPEHTWWKLLGLLLAAGLLTLIFGKGNYRIEGDFTVRAGELSHVVSPFDGYLEEALVRPGDPVRSGQVILRLDRRDLFLQRQATLADAAAHQGAMLRAEASADLAAMRVERARLEQANAQLELIEFRLQQSELRAPFDGVVVEGDLEQQIGAPLRQGESLVQIARLDDLHLELKIDERDIQELEPGRTGRVAFTSQPALKFPMEIERVEPAARVDEGGNLFVARAQFQTDQPEPWWRPGMTGIAKVDAGRRSYWWIVTHRTADFIRLRWWW